MNYEFFLHPYMEYVYVLFYPLVPHSRRGLEKGRGGGEMKIPVFIVIKYLK
jgi:hypothetical protein